MINTIFGIIFFLLAITIIVIVHELGHLIVAKRNGVKCFSFSIGMGPKLFTFYKDKSGTEYSVRLLPIGGFVMLAGEEEAEEFEFDESESLDNKTPWQKIKVLFAGALMNFILGWFVLFLSSFIFGVSVPADSNVINVVDATPAAVAGLSTGDQITAIDGEPTANYEQIDAALANKDQVEVTYLSNGATDTVTIIKKKFDCDVSYIGISPQLEKDKFNIIDSFKSANSGFFVVMTSVGTSLQMLTNGSAGVSDLMGPVGIATEASSVVTMGLQAMLAMIAFLSINIGIVNILPIPALDGGRILLALIELVTRRKVPQKIEYALNYFGFFLLMGLFVFVTFSDFGRIGNTNYYDVTAAADTVCVRSGDEFEYSLDFAAISSDVPEAVTIEVNVSDGEILAVTIADNSESLGGSSVQYEISSVEQLTTQPVTLTIDPDDNKTSPLDIVVKVKDEKGDTINHAYTRIDR